jgi:hypothetical protein
MSNMSDYLELKVLDHTLGTTSYTAPTVYLALYTSMPTDSSAGTEVASGRGYARQAVAFSAASSGSAANSAVETFGPNTTTNWGTVTGAALVDSGTIGAGNVLYYKAFSSSRAVVVGDKIEFAAGSITVSID